MSNDPKKEPKEEESLLDWIYDRIQENYEKGQDSRADVIEIEDWDKIPTGLDEIIIESELGETIVEFGLYGFLFSTHKILDKYGVFRFNNNYKGLTSGNCLIVNIKHDKYKSELFPTKFSYAMRVDWEIKGYGSSYYLIDNKHKIVLKELRFAVNLFEKYIHNFNDDKLSIQYSNDNEIPLRINYRGSDIRIYFFQESKII